MKIFMVFCALYGTRTWIEKLNSYHYEFRHTCQRWQKRMLFKMIRFNVGFSGYSLRLPSSLFAIAVERWLMLRQSKWMPNKPNETRNTNLLPCTLLIAQIISSTLDTYWSDKTFRSIDTFPIPSSISLALNFTPCGQIIGWACARVLSCVHPVAI